MPPAGALSRIGIFRAAVRTACGRALIPGLSGQTKLAYRRTAFYGLSTMLPTARQEHRVYRDRGAGDRYDNPRQGVCEMATCAATADDRRTDDLTIEEDSVGILHLSDLDMASWGTSLQPDAPAHQFWLNSEPHPPDEEFSPSSEEGDGRPFFERHDAYGEDVLRLRRLIVGR
jgi:hypothetical protein